LCLCDLHFHPNIYGLSKLRQKKRLKLIKSAVKNARLNFISSTEHVYKAPLEAYKRLAEAVEDLGATVIPGVEWVSREKTEIIFYYDSSASLQSALKVLKPFSRSVWDLSDLKNDTGAVISLPHPFTPGTTGAVNRLGIEAFERLLELTDYVETHNGLSQQFRQIWLYQSLSRLAPALAQKVEATECLPHRYWLENLGWAVGSDAHFAHELCSCGYLEGFGQKDWFEDLRARRHFSLVHLPAPPNRPSRFSRNMASWGAVIKEAWLKKIIRARFGF
jgi:predicted metal-dependent phosphoesterase TrpH